MKMLTIICRESLEDEVIALLTTEHVEGYTVISKVTGVGATGAVPRLHSWAGLNTLLLAVVSDDQLSKVVAGLRSLHDQLVQDRRGHEVPLKLFIQPCEMVL